MEPILEEYDHVIDFAVLSDEWEDYVVAFRVNLGMETYPDGPNIAVFWIDKIHQLRVIRGDKTLITGVPSFVDVPNEGLVNVIYNLMPARCQSRKPYDIYVTAVRNFRVVHSTIRIAEFKFKSGSGLVERTGGVIHNPPYAVEH